MDAEQMLKLIDAGFTKEEILSLAGDEGKKEEGTEAMAGEQGAESKTHEESIGPDTTIADVLKPLQDEIAKLGNTVKAIQESNLKNVSTASPNTDDANKKAIESFINVL